VQQYESSEKQIVRAVCGHESLCFRPQARVVAFEHIGAALVGACTSGECRRRADLQRQRHASTEVGSYFVVATSGDPNYSGSTNGVLVVTQATSTVTILGATPLNALAGQPVTVRYLVTSVGTPTGNVTIFSASGEQCTATVAAGECALTFSESSTRVLAASYNGDKNHQSSMSTNFDYGDLIFSDGFE
jgi:hypothetical protein